MPELPEVEVLVRHLRSLLRNRVVRGVEVRRPRVLRPISPRRFAGSLLGARFKDLTRRGKYLLFSLQSSQQRRPVTLIGHLGMTGRMYLAPLGSALPKHAAVVLNLGRDNFIFEDTRYFGRLTLDSVAVNRLGPEPLDPSFTTEYLARCLSKSRQAIKIKLLDQTLVAGLGNIYASEALFRAGVSPALPATRLNRRQVGRLWSAIRTVLGEAIECGSTVPLDYGGVGTRDGLFYFGRMPGTPDSYSERLRVYDRAGQPCPKCRTMIKRIVQGARSTFYCPNCQPT